MLLGTLGASLLGTGKGTIGAGDRTIETGENLNPPRHVYNFEIQKYNENEIKFNGFHSGNDLSKIKYGAYIINLDELE